MLGMGLGLFRFMDFQIDGGGEVVCFLPDFGGRMRVIGEGLHLDLGPRSTLTRGFLLIQEALIQLHELGFRFRDLEITMIGFGLGGFARGGALFDLLDDQPILLGLVIANPHGFRGAVFPNAPSRRFRFQSHSLSRDARFLAGLRGGECVIQSQILGGVEPFCAQPFRGGIGRDFDGFRFGFGPRDDLGGRRLAFRTGLPLGIPAILELLEPEDGLTFFNRETHLAIPPILQPCGADRGQQQDHLAEEEDEGRIGHRGPPLTVRAMRTGSATQRSLFAASWASRFASRASRFSCCLAAHVFTRDSMMVNTVRGERPDDVRSPGRDTGGHQSYRPNGEQQDEGEEDEIQHFVSV